MAEVGASAALLQTDHHQPNYGPAVHCIGSRDSHFGSCKLLVVLQFEHIKPINVCHADESWHPEQLNWIPASPE